MIQPYVSHGMRRASVYIVAGFTPVFYEYIFRPNVFDLFPKVLGFCSEVEEEEEKEGVEEHSHGAEMGKREMIDL